MFELYFLRAKPRPFDNLRSLLEKASPIGLEAEKVHREGKPYLDSEELQYWINQINVRQSKYDGSFHEVVSRVAEEIEHHKSDVA